MSHRCPTCGDEFETRRGLGVHHTHAHDERLPNRTCANCGERFYAASERKYCSDACLDGSDAYAGKNNPNYRGGKTTTACERCGIEFEYYPSEKEGRYCSNCVAEASWRTVPELHGRDNPRWNGGKRQRECEVCGDSFERYPSNLTGTVDLCSEDCRARWLSEAFTGEGHPNWQGGDVGPYGPGWNAVRRRALERDDHECVICSKDQDEIGRNPDVHHLVPVRAYAEADDRTTADAHFLDNVASLCVDCHRKADAGRISRDELRRAIR